MKNGKDAAPAIVISASAQVGANKTLSMQFGVPLDMTPDDLNTYVDKMMGIIERQNDKGVLEKARLVLEQAERDLKTNIEQRMKSENDMRIEFVATGRKGEFRPTGSQEKTLANFDSTTRNLRDNLIPKFHKDIADLERKIGA